MKFKCLNVIIFTFSLLIICDEFAKGQDIHFSQVPAVPLIINPANAGNGAEDFRIFNNYRNQWRAVDFPYHTYNFAFDKRLFAFGRMWGLGGYVLHDQSSNSHLYADKIFLSVSHSFFHKNHQFVAGIQPGIVLKYFNDNGISFGSQFDPILEQYNTNMPNYEDFQDDRMVYFDLNAGFLWKARIKKLIPSIGVSISHINRPVESFLNLSDSVPLPLKYTFQGNILIPFSERFELNPFNLLTYSRGANDFITGAVLGFYPENVLLATSKIYALGSLRVNPARNVDAAILGGGVIIGDFDICITYDMNISALRKVSNFRGAFELSVIYSINRRKTTGSAEPCYML